MGLPGREIFRFTALLTVLGGSGIAISYLLTPPPEPPVATLPIPRLTVLGSDIPEGEPAVGDALDKIRRYGRGKLTLQLPNDKKREIPLSDLGMLIDRVRLARFIEDARKPGSMIARARAANEDPDPGGPLEVPLPISVDTDKLLDLLVDLKIEVDTHAADAFVDLRTRELKPEKIGYRLDVYGTLVRVELALQRGQTEVVAAAQEIVPKLVASELGSLEFGDVLGYFETKYSRGKKYEDRTYNLRLAATKLSGTVVLPGETFDFNGVVGPRDEARGYRVAPVIAQGEVVDGLGGGTCQISGTLHGAALLAGMDIVERYPHSRPSYYIKLGLDATVVYPTINFRFKNPFDFPVVLHETVVDGTVRAEILGPKRKHTVSYFRRVDDVLPFEEVERPSDKLAEGDRMIVQRGIPGFTTTASRVVRNGAYATRDKWVDKYPPTMQIVLVGAGPRDLETKLSEDAHPEYVVDEYLIITQGPGLKTPGVKDKELGGGTIEKREPGRTGDAGWTEREGFAKSTPKAKDTEDDVADKDDADKKDEKSGDDKAGDDKAKADKAKDDKAKADKSKKKDKKKKKKGKTTEPDPSAEG